MLAVKHMLGLFDDPFRRIDPRREKARSRTRPNLALSREAGRKSIVMLKNEGDAAARRRGADRTDGTLRGRKARPQRALGGLWRQQAGGGPCRGRARRRRGRERQRHARLGRGGTAFRRIEAAVAAAQAADVVVLADRRIRGHVGRGAVAHRDRRPRAPDGAGQAVARKRASPSSWC
ncbi:hypothetical protein AB5I41_23995 [Sphingomonas sp. MMS24-JH45]